MSLIIDAAGDGRALGRAHGEAARPQVAAALAAWSEATLAGSRHSSAIDYARALIGDTGLVEAISRYTPELLAEIEGIAEGAAQPFELIAVYNLMDEQWWYDLGGSDEEPGCSVIGVAGQQGTLLCQNMDLPKFMDGSQVILRLRPEGGPEQVILSSAGLIGLTGANAAGIGICVNTLLMLNHDAAGLPVSAVFRHALAQTGVEAAVNALAAVPHASGQHYAIAGREGIRSLECSGGGSAEVRFAGPAMRHTNHPIVSRDEHAAQLALLEARGRVANSRDRLHHLAALDTTFADAARLRAWLDAPGTPICVTPGEGRPGFTFGSIVIEVAERTTVDIRPSFPGESDWQTFTL